jgi:hypothetical protein
VDRAGGRDEDSRVLIFRGQFSADLDRKLPALARCRWLAWRRRRSWSPARGCLSRRRRRWCGPARGSGANGLLR